MKMRMSQWVVILAAMVAAVRVGAQSADEILTGVRQALNSDRLESLIVEGRISRPGANGTTERGFEIRLKGRDKFLRKEVLADLGNMSVYRHSGLNGADGLINRTDQPPQLSGGTTVMFRSSRGPAAPPTPEQLEAQRKTMLAGVKKDYTRLALGIFGAASPVYPLALTYAGEATASSGTAQVIDVKADGMEARLFIDPKTHLPLMLSWMEKEPTTGGPVVMSIGGAGMSREELEKNMREREAAAKEAEAKARVVEYRLFYGDYKKVGGVMLPHSLQRTIDGKVTEEMSFDRVKVNTKIDDSDFAVTK